MEHEDDPDIDEPYVPPAENVLGLKDNSQSPTEQSTMGDTSEGQEYVGCSTILALINTVMQITDGHRFVTSLSYLTVMWHLCVLL